MRPALSALLFLAASGRPILLAEDWPGWRGPTGQGISSETGLPLEWSASQNVAWKTGIPGLGWSSPIVVGDRVLVTTATENGASCHVIALDAATGKVLWDREVFRQNTPHKQEKNSYASPTPASDGSRVYAVFGEGRFAAVNLDGTLAWTNQDVRFYSQHGLGASPILYRDLLIMPFDGSDPAEKTVGWKEPWDRAFILALDKATGRERYRAKRGLSRIAHVTPNILRDPAGDQLVSGAGDAVQGFDPLTGERIWSVYSQGEGVVPSIVIGESLIYSASGFEEPTIRAVRKGGRGEVTRTHIAWESKKGVPNQPSMLYLKPHLYAVTDQGIATCFEAETGRIVWQERIGGKHCASLIHAEGRIYFLSEEGESAVIEAGPRFKLLARNSLGETCQASYAVSGKRIFIRTEKNLYAISTLRRSSPR